MYDELINRLRETSVYFGESDDVSVMMIEAADAIDELQKITTHYEEESKGWWLAACDAKEEIERLKEQIPKWIPVTERLPEYGEKCLVVFKLHSHNDYYIGVSYCYVQKERFWSDCGRDYKVTHWMPLPQPPESEDE